MDDGRTRPAAAGSVSVSRHYETPRHIPWGFHFPVLSVDLPRHATISRHYSDTGRLRSDDRSALQSYNPHHVVFATNWLFQKLGNRRQANRRAYGGCPGRHTILPRPMRPPLRESPRAARGLR